MAGARGMAGSAIVRALKQSGYGDPARGGALLTPSRQELDLLDDGGCAPLDDPAEARCGSAGCRHRGWH